MSDVWSTQRTCRVRVCAVPAMHVPNVKVPLCVLFPWLNGLTILWMTLLWCLLLLHFRYRNTSLENKIRPRLEDE